MSNQARLARPSSTALNRVPHETSSLLRRAAAILIGIWFGGILLVALAAPASFRSVDSAFAAPPEVLSSAVKTLGPSTTRELLMYQVSEANRLLFETWGWVQSGLAVTVFIILLFGTTVGRPALAATVVQLLLALLMQFFMIPRISEIGRQMRARAGVTPQEMLDKFKILHLGFTAFELAVVITGSVLLVYLLRRPSGSRRHAD